MGERVPVFGRLFGEPYGFDFFQAVRLVAQLPHATDARAADPGRSAAEFVRFRAVPSLTFPPSAVADLAQPDDPLAPPVMAVAFVGLYGPSGVLPRPYTARVVQLERDRRGDADERGALRAWLDVFGHRFAVLFYRAWEKYRFFLAHDTARPASPDPDPFTAALYGFVGLGTAGLRGRLRVTAPARPADPDPADGPEVLARVRDLGLLRYAGLLSQRHRNAWGLGALVSGYFGLAVEVGQFHGQWLPLAPADQTRLGDPDGNAELGETAVAGDRVWDVQSKVRLRVGPVGYARFLDLLPDPAPVPARKTFFLVSHLARLYLGPGVDFDVQLVLAAAEVPACRLADDPATGPRLGWNAWLPGRPTDAPADDAVFDGDPAGRAGERPPDV